MANEKKETQTAEEMVSIFIPRDGSDDSDLFVSVNERTWLIKRGAHVEVPACVAEVLEHREEIYDRLYEQGRL